MENTELQASLDRVAALLRDPDFDLFKHGQLNEEIERLQGSVRDVNSITEYRHLSYAEMKDHREELLARLDNVSALLQQGQQEAAMGALRASLRVMDQS